MEWFAKHFFYEKSGIQALMLEKEYIMLTSKHNDVWSYRYQVLVTPCYINFQVFVMIIQSLIGYDFVMKLCEIKASGSWFQGYKEINIISPV